MINLGNNSNNTTAEETASVDNEAAEMLNFFGEATEVKTPGSGFNISTETNQDQEQGKTKISPRASASTAVAMVDTTQRIIFEPILNNKLKKKLEKGNFGSDEFALIENKASEKRTKDENILVARFEKIVSNYEKRRAEISFSETEQKEMKDILEVYFKETGKELSPSLMIACAFIGALGKRTTSIIFD